jgi:hypothetical protein
MDSVCCGSTNTKNNKYSVSAADPNAFFDESPVFVGGIELTGCGGYGQVARSRGVYLAPLPYARRAQTLADAHGASGAIHSPQLTSQPPRAIASSLFEDPLEVVRVPSGPEAFVFDSDRQAVLLFEEVDCSRRLSARRRTVAIFWAA